MKMTKRILALLICMCILFTYGNVTTTYAAQNTSLNYLVLGSSYIETPEEQFILADIGDGSTHIESAVVSYINETTGVTMQQKAGLIDGSSIVFYMNFPDSSYSGIYRITSLDYTVGGQSKTINLADQEITAVFGVNQKADSASPYAWVVDDSESIDDLTTVHVTDAQGNEVDAASLSMLSDEVSIEEQQNVKGIDGKIVITLNPGHAAGDPGTSATWNGVTYIERDLNLKIAQYCKEELDKYDNVEVYLSRTDNTTDWSIADMVSFAKSKKADLYVSIHLNSAGSSSANGAEIWIPHGNSKYKEYVHDTSKGLANEILKKLVALGLADRGVKFEYSKSGKAPYPDGSKADFYGEIYQTKLAGIPGMIVEHAFISNRQNAEAYLSSEEKIKALGQADAQAIIEYVSNNTIEHHHEDYQVFYNGVDYSAVYDYNYYIKKYPDLKKAFEGNDKAALWHFVNYGIKEGRQAKETFDVRSYKNRYEDLRRAFGTDLKKYYMHYINYGKKEGRQATGIVAIQNPITEYDGIDYSAVYDYNYYINKYPDLKKAFEGDDVTALWHFVNYGMKEGRQAKETFDVRSYRNKYTDLRKAYSKDLKKYYIHYINYGKKEGRQTTGTTSLQNPTTVYGGLDYSSVYDYNYYISKYPDLKKAFEGDDVAALWHFINYGMKEGRQAKATFNVNLYKSNYSDLYRAYGNNLKSYYLHYIKYGQYEKRIADKEHSVKTNIMGTSSTNVQQMAAYYKVNATYPSYYATTDAPTIEDFCQIYLEECAAEGVKAEIAFCQAMKETGFLRYGGAVKIEQFNFAGIGATDNGGKPASFDTVRLGVRAQIQHLKAYASTESLKNACVDPRFNLVTRETAPYVEWLGIQENPYGRGWASDKNYGYSILNDYVAKLKKY